MKQQEEIALEAPRATKGMTSSVPPAVIRNGNRSYVVNLVNVGKAKYLTRDSIK